MIMFYFSGTGNSKYIAELFCENMNAECYSIEEDTDFTKLIADNDTIAFCYPVYMSRVPRIMREFVDKYMAVYPAAGLIDYFTGVHLVLINKSATSRDEQAQLIIQEPIGEVMAAVMEEMV